MFANLNAFSFRFHSPFLQFINRDNCTIVILFSSSSLPTNFILVLCINDSSSRLYIACWRNEICDYGWERRGMKKAQKWMNCGEVEIEKLLNCIIYATKWMPSANDNAIPTILDVLPFSTAEAECRRCRDAFAELISILYSHRIAWWSSM